MGHMGKEKEADRIRDYFDRQHPEWRRWPRARAFVVRERRRLLWKAGQLAERPGSGFTVCDVGCGDGSDLAFWRAQGINEELLAGTELIGSRADLARRELPTAQICDVDGTSLPFTDNRFGLTSASLVLSVIREDDARAALFSEMWRITRPGGVVVIYDFRIKRPANDQVVALTSGRIAALGRPPAHRWLAAPLLPALELVLSLPRPIHAVSVVLPRTHAVWTWCKA
jgi:ubiquinone/menaquinone biosynthesis C-methylase UbiE